MKRHEASFRHSQARVTVRPVLHMDPVAAPSDHRSSDLSARAKRRLLESEERRRKRRERRRESKTTLKPPEE